MQPQHHQRQLKGESEPKRQEHGKRHVVVQPRSELDVQAGGVADQKGEDQPKHHEEGQRHAGEEQQQTERQIPVHIASLVG